MLYMGKDKHENEDLIRYGFPEDVWFHVDNLSSAHVYLRMNRGEKVFGLDAIDLPQRVSPSPQDATRAIQNLIFSSKRFMKSSVIPTISTVSFGVIKIHVAIESRRTCTKLFVDILCPKSDW